MAVELREEAVEYGRQASLAFEAAGGDALVQAAERDPAGRAALVAPVLAELGAGELSPRTDEAELEAAAALCRSAGRWALPYPLAEQLSRPTDVPAAAGLVVVATAAASAPRRASAASAPLGGLPGSDRWVTVGIDGRRAWAQPGPLAVAPRKSAFVTELSLDALDEGGAADVALALVLPCWTLLGMLDRAIELAVAHVTQREQFGQTLSSFQSVQFQLTDADVERTGVEVLAKYALWSTLARPADALADALALRLAAIEAADVVFRVAHQLHGALGFCDESTLSWLSRYSQPLRRLPFGSTGTKAALVDVAGRAGLTGIFDGASDWAVLPER